VTSPGSFLLLSSPGQMRKAREQRLWWQRALPHVMLLPSLPRAATLSGAYLEIPGILHSTDTMAVPRHLYIPDRHFTSH